MASRRRGTKRGARRGKKPGAKNVGKKRPRKRAATKPAATGSAETKRAKPGTKGAAKPRRRSKAKRRTARYARLASLFEPYVWSWFVERFGEPSPPQVASWPKIAEGRNTLIFSPTGSGKTLAAFLACIDDLCKTGRRGELVDSIHVLYVSPLKALNNDIQRNLVEPLQGISAAAKKAGVELPDVRSAVRTGDTTAKERAAMARRPPHIFITTPESLFIILATAKFREALRTVRYVIVDEIHAVCDNKRGVHLSLSLERLRHLTGRDFTRIGLSATQRPLDLIARFLVGVDEEGRPRPCDVVDVGARKNLNVSVVSPVDNLLEAHFDAIWGSAYDKMLSMIRAHGTTLVFTGSRYKTERTALRLGELSAGEGLKVSAHHGSMSKKVRLEAEEKLKRGELDALVATSSLELGIDVGSIDLVCQIESPKSVSRGMQRIGRAGHLLDATSEGRLIVTNRDDLVEAAVLVKAITDGEIDSTRVPVKCLDVLAQHVVGAVAADEWDAEELYQVCRRSFCYEDLSRDEFDGVLDMLAGNYTFDVEFPPYPKVLWDKVNDRLTPERAARLIAFRASGTIPDTADYDVYFEKRSTVVGRLGEGFVEELRAGDIFILGSSSWRVTGIKRNRVFVDDVYGQAPTVPFWHGERISRTYDLGVLVGRFRSEMDARVGRDDVVAWLKSEYHVDDYGARSIREYFREQKLAMGFVPSGAVLAVERFRDEVGRRHIVVHSPFGVRVNDAWAMALSRAVERKFRVRPQTATVDDGMLLTLPEDAKLGAVRKDCARLLALVTPRNVDTLLAEAVTRSPLFAARFRHNAVRSLMVLREYRGVRTPVWLQSLRASSLLDACRDDGECPLVSETVRECLNEAIDAPSLRKVLAGLADGGIEVRAHEAEIPSPFTHTLLLLGQYGAAGAVPQRERQARLMHLHREVLRQILDEETLRGLLDADVVNEVDSRLQHLDPARKALDRNELARVLMGLGDLVEGTGSEISIADRTGADTDAERALAGLVAEGRAVMVPIPTAETDRERWIATESFPLYRDAFAAETKPGTEDRKLLRSLSKRKRAPKGAAAGRRLDKLVAGYQALRFPAEGGGEYVAARSWIPRKILAKQIPRREARLELVRKFLRSHGPVTKYEIMARWGFSEEFVERSLEALREEGTVATGEYVPAKSFPQWCWKSNLEEIHRLTLARLRREMEPATPEDYCDFLLRRQHVHPETRLAGVEGLSEIIGQIEGQETYQAVYERAVFPARIADYDPSMLDRLCYGGEVVWRRFDYKNLKRGRIGFCFRSDSDWIAHDPGEVEMALDRWDDDIPDECAAVRRYLARNGACFFDDIVNGTKLDRRYALRAIWHLVWTGEATTDSYESIRHANFITGLSGCYDLGSRPRKAGVTIDMIVRHMLENRKLDPRLGRWAPTERLVRGDSVVSRAERAGRWAELLFRRYGIVCRESLRREVSAPPWKDVRRELARLELTGKVRRGYFVQGLPGEQYARPEAVDALHEAKLRRQETEDPGKAGDDKEGARRPTDDTMILANMCDPANPFGAFFAVTNESGEEVKYGRGPGNYMVVRAGRPILLWHGRVTLLVDMSRDEAEMALGAVIAAGPGDQVNVSHWNGHPIDVSPARHLLTTLGFVRGRTKWAARWLGMVHDGTHVPDEEDAARAEEMCPSTFEHAGKERAPVRYDAEWVASRSHETIREKVRELIAFLKKALPADCEFLYDPHGLQIRYRGVKCVNPHVQQKQIWLYVTRKGWAPGLRITPETDLEAEIGPELVRRFEATRREIDSLTASKPKRTPGREA